MTTGKSATGAVASGRDAVVDLLASNRTLRALSRPDLEHLLGFSQLRRVRRRQPLLVAGEAGAAVFAVVAGYVKLSRSSPGGREILLELAGPGSIFGELAVINGWRRSADALTLSECQILAIDGRHFLDALRRNPDAMIAIIRNLSERLLATTAQMDAMFLPSSARIAKALIRLAALHSQPTPEGLQIDVALSQRELGELAGLARESVNKQLATWRDERIIRLDGQRITLTNAAALQEIAERLAEPAAA